MQPERVTVSVRVSVAMIAHHDNSQVTLHY